MQRKSDNRGRNYNGWKKRRIKYASIIFGVAITGVFVTAMLTRAMDFIPVSDEAHVDGTEVNSVINNTENPIPQEGTSSVPREETIFVPQEETSSQDTMRSDDIFSESPAEPTEDSPEERPSDSVEPYGNGTEASGGSAEPEEEIPVRHKEPGEILVVIDPGHGGVDEGCIGGDVQEKDINLAIALLVKQKLLDMGYSVLMTREADDYLSLEKRVEIANRNYGDILVSIHQNSYKGEEVCGIETWYEEADAVSIGEENPKTLPDTTDIEAETPMTGLEEALKADRASSSRRLARLIQMETAASGKAGNRDVREKSYYVLANTSMPACLVETGFLTNPEERSLLADEAYQEKIASGIADGIELYFHPKTMYLTFDDGPKPENTETVLDLLKEQDIHATFFLIGKNVERYPEIARRIAEEGHTIGIHSYSHDYNKIYESVDSFLEDFQKAYDVIYEVVGVEPWLFRFPGGSVNSYNKEVYQDIVDEMTERGFVYFDWNASLQDAVKNPVQEELLETARTSAHSRDKVVMLAHDVKDATVECLPQLLDLFPEYKMEPITREVTPVQFKKD